MEEQTTAALEAIAKQLKKIAKELKRDNKRANEPLEKDKELINIPSDTKIKAAINTIKKYCVSKKDCGECRFFNDGLTGVSTTCHLRQITPSEWRYSNVRD